MILDLVSGPWAIHPQTYGAIREVYDRHLRGESFPANQPEARTAGVRPEVTRPQAGGRVAVVEVTGMLSKRWNLLQQLFGGSSMEAIARDLRAAAADPAVEAVLLYVDSPGGAVDGTQELAQAVLAVRGRKPIVAWSDGMMASGAYWIASAAERVYVSGDNVAVGSIGVVFAHVERSKMEEMEGLRTTEVVAGKYKRIASGIAPLSKEGRQVLQEQVDQIYVTFVGDVARHRGVSTDLVLERMADGKTFLGRSAIEAGLVDGIRTFDEVLAELGAPLPLSSAAKLQAARTSTRAAKEDPMSRRPGAPDGNAFPPAPAPALSPAYLEGLIDVWEEHGVLCRAGREAERELVSTMTRAQLESYRRTKQAEYDSRVEQLARLSGVAPSRLSACRVDLPEPQLGPTGPRHLTPEEEDAAVAAMLTAAPRYSPGPAGPGRRS